jgi:hypothetical protein
MLNLNIIDKLKYVYQTFKDSKILENLSRLIHNLLKEKTNLNLILPLLDLIYGILNLKCDNENFEILNYSIWGLIFF